MKPRIFTVAQANRSIPVIQKILGNIETLQSSLKQKHDSFKKTKSSSINRDESINLSRDVEAIELQISNTLQWLTKIGCVMKNDGTVNFYTVKDGFFYELCWRSGEEEIRSYHEFGEGFIGKQSLTQDDILTMGEGFAISEEELDELLSEDIAS